ncbi:MAG: hypothetical protein II272_07015 [Oscillospiraceae bacterium]|jgi:hypothetical protein|nr:hypothetical protein [Oscillospiraceae bacterium]
MKKMISLFLLLSLLLLCCACSSDKPQEGSKNEEESKPQISYAAGSARYTQPGAKRSMELHFEEPVAAGSKIVLSDKEKEILSFTTEQPISELTIEALELKENLPYRLTVNGELQRHGGSGKIEPPDPGFIPEPEIPTIPIAPMTESPENGEPQPSEPVPGVSFDPNLPFGSIPDFSGTVQGGGDRNNGELSTEPFAPGKGDSLGAPAINPMPGRDLSGFILTGANTVFDRVRPAD